MKIEKTYCKIYKIDTELRNGSFHTFSTIKMYLPNGEILRKLKKEFDSELKKLNLWYQDAEFMFCAEGDENHLRVYLEPYIQEYNQELEDMLKEMEELI